MVDTRVVRKNQIPHNAAESIVSFLSQSLSPHNWFRDFYLDWIQSRSALLKTFIINYSRGRVCNASEHTACTSCIKYKKRPALFCIYCVHRRGRCTCRQNLFLRVIYNCIRTAGSNFANISRAHLTLSFYLRSLICRSAPTICVKRKHKMCAAAVKVSKFFISLSHTLLECR